MNVVHTTLKIAIIDLVSNKNNCLPQKTSDIIGPIVRKHHQKESDGYENYPRESHTREMSTVQHHVQG